MSRLLFELHPCDDDDQPLDVGSMVQLMREQHVVYSAIDREGEAVVVYFNGIEESNMACRQLDGCQVNGRQLVIKADLDQVSMIQGSMPVIQANIPVMQGQVGEGYYLPQSEYVQPMNMQPMNVHYQPQQSWQTEIEEYPNRILIPTEMVKVVLGKNGSTITGIQCRTNTKIDVHRDKPPLRHRQVQETTATIKGQPGAFSIAIAEILTVLNKEYERMEQEGEKRSLQLKILAHDSLCGRVIGKGGFNLKQARTESGAKIVISNHVYEDTSFFSDNSGMFSNGERAITIEGDLQSILEGEKIISRKLRTYLERDMKKIHSNVPWVMGIMQGQDIQGGLLRQGILGGGYMKQGILNGGYPPLTQLIPQPRSHFSDKTETSFVNIPTKDVGAMIGRTHSHINKIKQYSQASVQVLEGDDENTSKVEIIGNPEAQWKAMLCVFSKIKEGMGHLPYSEAHLRVEFLVPGLTVGRIIGRKGQVVQEIQEKAQTDIEVPKDKQGDDLVPVSITGTFNGVQITLNRIREIVVRAVQKD